MENGYVYGLMVSCLSYRLCSYSSGLKYASMHWDNSGKGVKLVVNTHGNKMFHLWLSSNPPLSHKRSTKFLCLKKEQTVDF